MWILEKKDCKNERIMVIFWCKIAKNNGYSIDIQDFRMLPHDPGVGKFKSPNP